MEIIQKGIQHEKMHAEQYTIEKSDKIYIFGNTEIRQLK